MEIQKVNFTVDSTHIFFDANGDPSLGYDVLYWHLDETTRHTRIEAIGEYWPNEEIRLPEDLVENMRQINVRSTFQPI